MAMAGKRWSFHPEISFYPEPYYLMAIGGEGNSMVEVASLNPASDPLPACLEYLSPLPDSLYGAAGGLDNDGLDK